ncbi:MAG: hypothetical protein ACI4MT_05415 [Christensenellales bacterium]
MDFRSFSNMKADVKGAAKNGGVNDGKRTGDNGKGCGTHYGNGTFNRQNSDVGSGGIGAEEIKNKIDGLKGKSEKDLMNAMLGEASRLKGEGKFNANELEEAFQKAKEFLTPDQLAKMRGLIDMLK